MFTIDSTIDIPAPLAHVRTAITTEAGYRAWFAQDADFDGKQGTFRFAQPTETRSVTLQVDRCDDQRHRDDVHRAREQPRLARHHARDRARRDSDRDAGPLDPLGLPRQE